MRMWLNPYPGAWDNVPIETSGTATVCQYDMTKICPTGWKFLRITEKCYKYVETKTTWKDAITSCQSENPSSKTMNLASIPDKRIHTFILTRVVSAASAWTRIWLGGYKKTDGKWAWSDGTAWAEGTKGLLGGFEKNPWLPNKPTSKKDTYLQMLGTGNWDEGEKDEKRGALCQFELE